MVGAQAQPAAAAPKGGVAAVPQAGQLPGQEVLPLQAQTEAGLIARLPSNKLRSAHLGGSRLSAPLRFGAFSARLRLSAPLRDSRRPASPRRSAPHNSLQRAANLRQHFSRDTQPVCTVSPVRSKSEHNWRDRGGFVVTIRSRPSKAVQNETATFHHKPMLQAVGLARSCAPSAG